MFYCRAGLGEGPLILVADLEFDFAGLGLYLSEYILGCANPHNGQEGFRGDPPPGGECPMSVLAEVVTWFLGMLGGTGT